MTQTPRTDAMESAVSSECRGLTDDTRNWLMQAKSRELNRTLELETIELKRQLAECDKEYGLAILTLEQKKKLLESAEQALAERDRRLAEAQMEAERYRWLRDGADRDDEGHCYIAQDDWIAEGEGDDAGDEGVVTHWLQGTEADAAIDAAIQGQKK